MEILAVATRGAERQPFEQLRPRLADLIDQVPSDNAPDSVGVLRHTLWDSLIAAYLSPTTLPHDRHGQIDGLRAFHLIDRFERITGREPLLRVLAATPLIPTWAVAHRSTADQPDPGDTGPSAPGHTDPTPGDYPGPHGPGGPFEPGPDPDRLNAINALRHQLIAIPQARRDLDAAYWAVARDRESGPSPAPKASPAVPQQGEQAGRSVVTVRDVAEPPWRRSEQLAERLQPETTSLLDTLDARWRTTAHHDVAAMLDRQQNILYDRLLGLGGLSAIRRLEDRPDLIDDDIIWGPGPNPFPIPTHSVGTVCPAGIGDLLIVQERVLRYEESTVAHIENVMRSESKQRIHRRLDRDVETVSTTTEESEETERDLQTTERYELSTEVERTLESNQSLETGVSTSASYGPVLSIEASAEFATDTSSSTATKSSSDYAQEVVDKSVSRLSTKIKTQIIHKTISEVEETNTHGFDNRDAADHAVGVYRWIDEILESQIYNYGRRLFMEFVVPEPGAFYRHAQASLLSGGVTMSPPKPLEEGFSFLDLTPGSYQTWVNRYQVPDVSPPPAEFVTVPKVVEVPETVHRPDADDYIIMMKSESLSVPEGYEAVEAWVYGTWTEYAVPSVKLHVHLGRRIFDKDKANNDDYLTLHDEEGVLQIGVYTYEIAAALLSVDVRCQRKTETLLQWQLETFQKVVDAYNSQLAAYEAHVAGVQTVQWAAVNDLHPDKKRQIEKDELQKGALILLTNQHFADFDAVVPDSEPYGYPELDVDEAMEEGRYAQFMQQCFEWVNVTYSYYPYIWGRKSEWVTTSSASDSDAQFESFLKAGAARVLVPVRPTYEKSLLYYLTTGEIWNGGEPPVIDDPNYVAIVDEIAEAQDVSLEDAEKYGDPWTYSVPTELVKLQDDAELPSWEAPIEEPAEEPAEEAPPVPEEEPRDRAAAFA